MSMIFVVFDNFQEANGCISYSSSPISWIC